MPRLVIAAAALLAALPALAETPAEQAAEIHATAMQRAPDYAREGRPKAMDACIATGEDGTPVVRGVAYARTSQSSDKPVATNRLANTARERCLAWKARHGEDCACVPLDRNGKNVLKLPLE